MGRGEEYTKNANEELHDIYESPMDLEAYVDHIFENPGNADQSAKYLLDAIESMGTRTVVEHGEEKERYEFFDDPHNDGEHAILGNTEVLNGIVDDLRSIVSERGKDEKVLWIEGPTATGKSELKRCLVNGLHAYSRTDEGRRYTLEWNIESYNSGGSGVTYGGGDPDTGENEAHWHQSPVQTHPLSVFPEETREQIVEDLNEEALEKDDPVRFRVDTDLDPFSREAYKDLERWYRADGVEEDLFEQITDGKHLRVTNYLVDEGRGIGILQAEDDGTPKQRLVGEWMRGMLSQLDSQGKKDARAFSYDGILSQGNGLLTVIEDSDKHMDLLTDLMNIPDENMVKLDKGIGMDLDTVLMMISNPNLEAKLNQDQEKQSYDDLRALRRRLDKHEFRYLTNYSLESQLLRKELEEEDDILQTEDYDTIRENLRKPLELNVKKQDGDIIEKEVAPHALEAAALYDVVSRLSDEVDDLTRIEKALLYDQGYLETEEGEKKEKDEFDFPEVTQDGKEGIPATYTRDVIAQLLQEEKELSHEELDVENIIMPSDILDAMEENFYNEELFSSASLKTEDGNIPSEIERYQELKHEVDKHIFQQQESDVLDALMRDMQVEKDTVERYFEHVYAWINGDSVETDYGTKEPDALFMQKFETSILGQFEDSAYGDDDNVSQDVREFREEEIVQTQGTRAWRERNGEYETDRVDVEEIPALKKLLGNHDWGDVKEYHDEFDPRRWEDVPEDTPLEELREQTVENMIDMFDYSEESAELTANRVIQAVQKMDLWEDDN